MARITLRLPDDLHEQLVEIAKEDDRSLNAQIVASLKNYILARRLRVAMENSRDKQDENKN